jgi:hypothetical protein
VPDACDISGGTSGDCNSDGVPDDCQIDGNDCNADGIPDECQLANNDCNDNGRPDQCDLADGTEIDCNANQKPDSCEYGEPYDYRIDDGGPEFGIRGAGDNMAWLTNHRVTQGASTVEAIEIMFVFAPNAQPATIHIWSDPNGDGNPADAQVLASKTVPIGPLGVLQTIDMPDTYVGVNGTSFFIGAITTATTNDFPGPLDTSGAAVLGRSWIVGSDNAIDPNDLFTGVLEAKLIENAVPFPGKWVLRAKAQSTIYDCNGNEQIDACEIAAGTAVDSDGTGIPDECEDCNSNGFLDSTDIAAGTSADCNDDLVPDECQLGEPEYALEYLIDDGTRDGNYGFGSIADVLWMNRFNVESGSEWIGEIRVVLGNVIANEPYQVALWSDPNNDGDPTDAQLLVTANARAANGNTSIFNEIRIDPTYIGEAGTSFFAGVIYSDRYGNQFPVAVDTSTISQRTWIAAGAEVDPNNLSSAVVFGYLTQATALVRAMGFDGALPFDCNRSGVPDTCEIADGLLADANGNGIPDCCESGTGCKGCATDLDGDGQVGASDLSLVLANWGAAAGDVTGDGTTDAADLSEVLATWGVCR